MTGNKMAGIFGVTVLLTLGAIHINNKVEPEKVVKKTTTIELKEGEVLASYSIGGTDYSEIMTEKEFHEIYEPRRKNLTEAQNEATIIQDNYDKTNLHINSMKEYSGEIEYYCPIHESKHTELYYNAMVEKRNQYGREMNHYDFIMRTALDQLPSISRRYEE